MQSFFPLSLVFPGCLRCAANEALNEALSAAPGGKNKQELLSKREIRYWRPLIGAITAIRARYLAVSGIVDGICYTATIAGTRHPVREMDRELDRGLNPKSSASPQPLFFRGTRGFNWDSPVASSGSVSLFSPLGLVGG